jgi:hypothetical protein
LVAVATTFLSSEVGVLAFTTVFFDGVAAVGFIAAAGTLLAAGAGAAATFAGAAADADESSWSPPQFPHARTGASANAANAVNAAVVFMATSCGLERTGNLRLLRIIVNNRRRGPDRPRPSTEAVPLLTGVWVPNEVWMKFLDDTLAHHGKTAEIL